MLLTGSSPILPSARLGSTLTYIPPLTQDFVPHLYLFGGMDEKGPCNDHYFYNLDTQRWTEASGDSKPCARESHTAILWGRKVVIFGGTGAKNERLNDVATYDVGK